MTFVCSSNTHSLLCFALHVELCEYIYLYSENQFAKIMFFFLQSTDIVLYIPFSGLTVLFYSLSFLYSFFSQNALLRFRRKKLLVKGGVCKIWTEFKFKTLKKNHQYYQQSVKRTTVFTLCHRALCIVLQSIFTS